jgi:uncharacterized membrane protein YjfL (UPF0719 family)
MDGLLSDVQLSGLISTLIYSLAGLIFFLIAYFLIEKLTPFSVRKEIEEDQNVALGVIIGAMMIGLAIIIAAAIASPSESGPPLPPAPVEVSAE